MKKPSKRKKISNFDKDCADVVAVSDQASYFEQKKLIALDKEEQSQWENETVSASQSKIEDNLGKDKPAEPGSQSSWQSRSQSFVPLDQRSENKSSGSNHFRHVL